jgi:hypothetical protein
MRISTDEILFTSHNKTEAAIQVRAIALTLVAFPQAIIILSCSYSTVTSAPIIMPIINPQ